MDLIYRLNFNKKRMFLKQTYKLFLWLLAILISLPACNTDSLIDLNDDPNASEVIDWHYLFTNGIVNTAGNRGGFTNTQLLYCSAMIQHLSDIVYAWNPGDKYFEREDIAGAYFEACYFNMLKNFEEVIKQTGPDGEDPQMVNLHHAARVMRVFAYHRCTDLYGDIPYFEANKAFYEGIFYPVFDTQQDIYSDMLNELSEAAEGFDSNYKDETFDLQDIIYDGEVEKWRKFAYSLMLRLAMRISNVDESTAMLYIEEAINGGVFTSNDDIARIPMATGPDLWYNTNGISRWFIPWDGGLKANLSNTLIDLLRDNNDPRLMIISSGIGHFGSPDKITDPALQKGIPNGHDANSIRDYEGVTGDVDLETTYSRINEMMLDLDDPTLMQTYAEVELLLAEAALNGWHSGDPTEHYENGIRAAMQMYTVFDPSLSVSDTEVDAYLATHPFDSANGLEMIATQYWVATFLNFFEAYANWRRTGYPVLIPVNYPGNHTNGTIPSRLIFDPQSVVANEANYLAAVERMGGDELTTKVWWDGGN
jgi:hypothetical protein